MKSSPDAPTLRNVAQAAGVSTASASRALSRPDQVSAKLKDQVERVARALGYVPNAAAQALSGHPRRLVGVALGGLDDPLIAAMLDAMARRLAASDVALLLATGAVGELETATSVRELISRGARAVIFAGAARPMRAAEDTQANCLPWLSLDAPDSTQRIGGASGFDRARAHALALRYLYDLGHRRIALLGSGGARLRQATRAALGETSLVLSHIEARATAHGRVADGLAKLLAASAPPTALLCATDSLAAVALNECARQGISVPHALAIVGFGDSELGRHLRPSLTTVRVPAGDAGVAAAEHVVALLEGRMVLPVKLAVKLIVRESSGPVRTDGS